MLAFKSASLIGRQKGKDMQEKTGNVFVTTTETKIVSQEVEIMRNENGNTMELNQHETLEKQIRRLLTRQLKKETRLGSIVEKLEGIPLDKQLSFNRWEEIAKATIEEDIREWEIFFEDRVDGERVVFKERKQLNKEDCMFYVTSNKFGPYCGENDNIWTQMYYQLEKKLIDLCHDIWSDYLTEEELDDLGFDYLSDVFTTVSDTWTRLVIDSYEDNTRFWAIRNFGGRG